MKKSTWYIYIATALLIGVYYLFPNFKKTDHQQRDCYALYRYVSQMKQDSSQALLESVTTLTQQHPQWATWSTPWIYSHANHLHTYEPLQAIQTQSCSPLYQDFSHISLLIAHSQLQQAYQESLKLSSLMEPSSLQAYHLLRTLLIAIKLQEPTQALLEQLHQHPYFHEIASFLKEGSISLDTFLSHKKD